jgi:hypothetical protein
MNNWYVGVTKTVAFCVGALNPDDVVYLDYTEPGSLVVMSAQASILSRTTGACQAVLTPAVPGTWKLWPRVMSGTTIVGIGNPCGKHILAPGN